LLFAEVVEGAVLVVVDADLGEAVGFVFAPAPDLRLNSSVAFDKGGSTSPPNITAAVNIPAPPPCDLAVFIGLPVAQAPAVVTPPPFKVLEVELYQICPSMLDSLDLMLLPRCFVLVYLYILPY
jgi:hypothetical protein